MDGELKKIKKLYGEDFAKLCRSLFPKLLEREGDLLEILTDTFAPSRSLFDAITADDDKKLEFKYFVYNKAGIEQDPAGYQDTAAPPASRNPLRRSQGTPLPPMCRLFQF